jgi:transposase
VHLILDNYATHNYPAVRAWLASHPRFVLHFTPTSSSWLNMVESCDINAAQMGRDHLRHRLKEES